MTGRSLVPYRQYLPSLVPLVYREPDGNELLEWIGQWKGLTTQMIQAPWSVTKAKVWEVRCSELKKLQFHWHRLNYFTEQLITQKPAINFGKTPEWWLESLSLYLRVGETNLFAPRPWLNYQGKLVIELHDLRFT